VGAHRWPLCSSPHPQPASYSPYAPSPAHAIVLHEATPDSKTVLWNDVGHGLNQQAVIDRYNWLHEEIGLDPLQ